MAKKRQRGEVEEPVNSGSIPDLDTFLMQVLPDDPPSVKDAICKDKVDINVFLNGLTIGELAELKSEYGKYQNYKFKDTPIRAYSAMLPLMLNLKDYGSF